MLPLVFVLLAIALIVGPIMMMQPNSRQRKEIAFRNRAMSLGLKVHILPLPVAGGSRQVSAYCLPWTKEKADLRSWMLVRGSFEHELHFSGCWEWRKGMLAPAYWHAALKQALELSPDSVLALANGPQGLSIFWSEKGDIALIDTFVDILRPLAELGYEGHK